jgi:hypothetical protein
MLLESRRRLLVDACWPDDCLWEGYLYTNPERVVAVVIMTYAISTHCRADVNLVVSHYILHLVRT